ncbi:hypothetical protein PoB_004883900 [Plakobranchus ocellatus]|uniref:Clathrin light chain n=1 Tax=Plakobranchus ocellatus TaxID=259542 RepID=A0AAV4BVA2_9GAST|nr:hypothetical protein PoB_004883900 [Plakobranchus ocellatus]
MTFFNGLKSMALSKEFKREVKEHQLKEEEAKRTERVGDREAERWKKIQLEKSRIQAALVKFDLETSSIGETGTWAMLLKVSNFVDGKDDLDSWLMRLERFAAMRQWSREKWASSLSRLST